MEVTEHVALDHQADVGAVRRRFASLAAEVGLDESRASDAGLIASELAANVIRHARNGGVLLHSIVVAGTRGVAIAAWDRGPGMDLDACLRDGMSTAGTAGNGLGAVTRLATRWDAYAPLGKGSVVVATVLPRSTTSRAVFEVGAVSVPYPGEIVCGDGWACDAEGDAATVLVCDGLGHGDGAAAATRAVIGAFCAASHEPPGEILARCDRAARGTRGAAATVVRVDRRARTATIAAVGNVGAWIAGDTQRSLVTQHGTLGHATPRIREESYPYPEGAVLVVCSDGLKSRIDLLEYAGLAVRNPTTIAAVLWRDHARGRDDATALALREVQ